MCKNNKNPRNIQGFFGFFNKTRLIVSLQGLSHHQFLGQGSAVLFNDIDKIDTLVPAGSVDVDDLAALLLADLLSDKVIDLHFVYVSTFHGELACGGVG